MSNQRVKLIVGVLALASLAEASTGATSTSSAIWDVLWSPTFASFFGNMFSYALIVVPAALFIRYFKNKPEAFQGRDPMSQALRSFVHGRGSVVDVRGSGSGGSSGGGGSSGSSGSGSGGGGGGGASDKDGGGPDAGQSWGRRAAVLAFLVLGLQGSYIVWGVLQEQMMTQNYGLDGDGKPIKFTNSQYLVFLNRALAFLTAVAIVNMTSQPRTGVPLYKYSFPSMSNILSSWCQYEALKFVSFPTQVLAKASKTIPVMLMGRVVEGKSYPMYEYVCAAIMSVGVSLFFFARAHEDGAGGDESKEAQSTTLTGLLMLVGYMVFDSFTSNYQSSLFKTYKMSEYQMMLGVNLFSSFFCLWTLVQRNELYECLSFTLQHRTFLYHSLLLSFTSAAGQVFIFHTISRYGALVFTIIMTTRQAFSVFLSAMIFQHDFSLMAWLGIIVVFISIFARAYVSANEKKEKPAGRAAKQ